MGRWWVKTLWCQWCDREIFHHEETAMLERFNPSKEEYGPLHFDCAYKVLREHELQEAGNRYLRGGSL